METKSNETNRTEQLNKNNIQLKQVLLVNQKTALFISTKKQIKLRSGLHELKQDNLLESESRNSSFNNFESNVEILEKRFHNRQYF